MDTIFFLILRRMRAPLLTLLLAYAIAIFGLVLIPGQEVDGSPWHMDFFHALYFVSYMATTIGFGELPYEFSDAQRLWVLVCIYATVIAWIYSIGSLIALLQDKTLQRAREKRWFESRVKAIREPFYLVCGYGQTGSGLVRALTNQGQRAVVLDSAADRVAQLRLENLREFVPALRADVRRPESLLLAGLRRRHCAAVLALTSSNEVNLKVALASKLIKPSVKVICRADSHDVEANMASFGTDHIYDPFDIFSDYLATALRAPGLALLQDWLSGAPGSRLKDPVSPPTKGLWILCGYGRLGKALCDRLIHLGIEVIVIEATPERTGEPPVKWVRGWGTEAKTLLEAEIDRAVGLVAGTNNDTNNLSILMTAKELRPDLFTLVRENQEMNELLFSAIGADLRMRPSAIVAQRIRTLLSNPLVMDFIAVARRREDSWACELVSRIAALVQDSSPEVWEVRIDEEGAYALLQHGLDRSRLSLETLLRDPSEREQDLPVIALMHQRETDSSLLPKFDRVLMPGDRLLFCGSAASRSKMSWVLQNCHALNYVITGEQVASGWVWRWLSRLKPGAQQS